MLFVQNYPGSNTGWRSNMSGPYTLSPLPVRSMPSLYSMSSYPAGGEQQANTPAPFTDRMTAYGRTVRVGTSGDYPPFSFKGAGGELMGLDIDIARLFCSAVGVHVEFVLFRWSEWIQDLSAAKFDVAMSGITITAKRREQVAFAEPYVESGAVPMTSPAVVASDYSALNTAGIRLVVNHGGYLEGIARQFFPKAQILPLADNTLLGDYVTTGRADSLLTDSLEASAIALRYPRLVKLERITLDQHGYAVSPTATDLLHALNGFLRPMKADGSLRMLQKKYGIQV